MSAAVNIHLEVGSWKFEVRRKRLGEGYAFGRAGFLDGGVMGPPLLPGLRVVAEGFTGDEAKGAVNPAARVGIQSIVIEKIQEIGNGGEALLVGEHAGFGDVDGRAAHAQIVRLHGGEHEIEQAIGILQAAAPAIRVLADKVERGWLVTNGELEELLGLLLRGEASELGEFGVYGGGSGLRCCGGACVGKLAQFEFGPDGFEAADFKPGAGGKSCRDKERQAVPAEDAEREQAGFARVRIVWCSHEVCLALPSRTAFRHKLRVALDGNNGTGSQPSGTRG